MPDPFLTCDALDDLAGLDPFALDPSIGHMCDDAQAVLLMQRACASVLAQLHAYDADLGEWLGALCGSAIVSGTGLFVAMLRNLPRVASGYTPEPQRRNVRHRVLRDGLRTRGPSNPYDAQRNRAARDGFVNGVYVGAKEVA